MEQTRFELGTEQLKQIDGMGGENVILSLEDIVETFIQCISYTGFPKVLNAIFTAKKVFAERSIDILN